MTATDHTLPHDRLRCRSGRHLWVDDTARERCCDPDWDRILVAVHEWETPELSGIEVRRTLCCRGPRLRMATQTRRRRVIAVTPEGSSHE